MKKKLEGELISIAHRVLKLKNKSETVQLQQEAKKIYEQLTILRFYEENFETIKNEISPELFEEKLEQIATIDSVETNDLEEKVVEISQPIINEDLFVDKEEDQHQNVTVEHRGSDVIDKVRHQQARNRRSHAVDEVNEAGDQTECQHQAICLARSTLPRNTKLRWIRYRIFIQSRENGRVRAQNGSCNLACLDHASNVHQQL